MCLSFLVEIGNLCVERTRCFAVCAFPDGAACPPRSVAVLRCSAEGRPDLRALPELLLGALEETPSDHLCKQLANSMRKFTPPGTGPSNSRERASSKVQATASPSAIRFNTPATTTE